MKENSQLDNNTELYNRLQSGFPCRSYKILVFCIAFIDGPCLRNKHHCEKPCRVLMSPLQFTVTAGGNM